MKLTYTLPGRDYFYAPHLLELIENNHTVIAGATGAGKSVLENGIINALLCTQYPGKVETGRGCYLVLIDPKRVELRKYKDLPHTLFYADQIENIVTVLEKIRVLIDVRFNEMIKKGVVMSDDPPVYVFIDEIITLLENKKYCEKILEILTDCLSISRAANIFFVISSQCVARSTLPNTIILNCNCRVALYCNYAIESRQIIGSAGAETLPKNGYAIVVRNTEKYKIKIPFYEQNYLNAVVNSWNKQHKLYNRFLRWINTPRK